MNAFAAAILLATGLTAPTAPGAEPAPTRYELHAEIRDGDKVAARPRLVTRAGEAATIHIANGSYSLRLTATPDASAQVAVNSLVTSWSRSGLVHQDKHTQLSANGTPTALRFTRTDPGTGEQRELSIDIKVVPVTR